ncbi:MAG: PAS domain S-box protein [Nitrospirae bacterium]|nr:PAS domain S-box protein [Nitrospirota bacterium]
MLKILLIEDNPGDARLIEEMLKESGHEFKLECVTSLSSGIDEVRLDGFNVILLDLGLPDSQGLGTLTRLSQTMPEAPIIVLTGLADEETGSLAVKGGAQDYLIKGQIDHNLLSRSIAYAIERTKVEAEREQYFKFFQTSSDLMCMADPNGAFIKTNPAFSEALGYSGAELVSRPFIEFVHPDDKQSTLDEMAGQLQRGFTLNFENRYICKDGSLIWLSWKAIYNKKEKITYATARDITLNKWAEEALRESEERFKLIFESSTDGILLAGIKEKKFSTGNKKICEMLGYTLDEIKNIGVMDIHPEADLPYVIDKFERQAKEEFSLITDIPVKRKDGSIFYADINSFPIKLGGKDYLAGSFRDITGRKRLEEAVKVQTKRFETFFTNSITPLAFLDKDFNFIRVNKAYADATQRDISEFPGRNHFELYPSDAKAIFEEVVRTKTAFQTFARPFIFTDHPEWGVTYWDWTLVPTLDNNGEVEFLAFSLVDVTEQKKAEQERERLNKELEQILYAASHDLKTPLVNINGYTGEVKKSIENIIGLAERGVVSSEIRKEITSLAMELPEWFAFISSSVSRMDRLLNGLLQFSRSGSVDLKMEEIDMNTLINEIAGNLNYRLKEAGASLEVAGLPGCGGDREQINRIFSNLMENAVKYLDPSRKGEIKVTGHIKDNLSVYCVEDNGIGIAAEHQKQIFHIFHQLDPSITGEGLGLAIVQRMVERHGGKIWLESEKGKGCRFCVALPRKQ